MRDDGSWAEWSSFAKVNSRPGWPMARFPIHRSDGGCVFVTGFVNDMFGIFDVTGTIRDTDHATGALQLRTNVPVFHLAHLGAGLTIGVMDEYGHALLAGSIANRDETWRGLTGPADPLWRPASARLQEALFHGGVVLDEACRFESSPVFRFMPEVLTVGRPEKLS